MLDTDILQNGRNHRFRSGEQPPDPPRQHPLAKSMPGGRGQFSAAMTERWCCRLRLALAAFLLGLGTTGSLIVHYVIQRLLTELRRPRIPRSVSYLLVDAAAAQEGMDTDHFRLLPGGVDGAGGHALRGFDMFHSVQNYRDLRAATNSYLLQVFRGDPELQWLVDPREAMNFFIVAGPGGTSTGCRDSAIGLIHDVARDRHIRTPRIHVVQVGSEMPLRDRTRQVTVEQEQIVRANGANLLIKTLGDHADPDWIREQRPDGTDFPVQACQRVWSITVADQGNGQAECSTMQGLIRVIGNALFLRIFTQAGQYLAERFCDIDQQGGNGRGSN